MFLKKVDGLRAVKLPDGTVLTRADLPPTDTRRWVASRKATVVRAVVYGLLGQTEALAMYDISQEEFASWLQSMQLKGVNGLKVTQLQQLRSEHR